LASRQRFRPAERVTRRGDYTRIYDTGTRLHGRLMTVFIRPTDLPHPRLGIAATRRIGSAVRRNRAKRLVRELFRHHKPTVGLDIVVVPRRELLDAPFASLEAEFCALLERRARGGPSRQARPRGATGPAPDPRL
jgi:ribonuclease P protein component